MRLCLYQGLCKNPATPQINRACRVAEVGSLGERFQPKEHDVLFLG